MPNLLYPSDTVFFHSKTADELRADEDYMHRLKKVTAILT